MKPRLLLYTFLLSGFSALAQEQLNETLYVEGEYVPTVVRQDKIHLLPQKQSFDMPGVQPPSATGLLAGNYSPEYYALVPPLWRSRLQPYTTRGYLDVALGSYLNSTLSAGYGILRGENTTADIMLQHNSTSLFHPRLDAAFSDQKRYRYDEALAFTLTHRMGDNGTLSGAARYHLGKFNYYGAIIFPLNAADNIPSLPQQTLNDASLRLQWLSARRGAWQWGVRAHGAYFGYSRFYTPLYPSWNRYKGQSETEAALGATAALHPGDAHKVSLDVDFTNLSYNSPLEGSRSRSMQNVALRPAYTYCDGAMSARLGVRADVTAGAGKALLASVPSLRYSTFHLAPDVQLSYDAGRWNVTLSATGGESSQSMRELYQLDYYSTPMAAYLQPAFIPLEAKARFDYTGDGTLRFGADISYMQLRHLYLGGMYMSELCTTYPVGAAVASPDMTRYFDPQYTNLSGIRAGVDMEWTPFSILTVGGRATYQPQNARGTGYFNGYDRPRWVIDAEARVRPVKPLTLSLAYRYRGVRNVYYDLAQIKPLEAYRLPDICNISFGARYNFTPRFSVYASADNLLGKRLYALPMQIEEGFNFLIGLDIRF